MYGASLSGNVDRVILTGGISHSEMVVKGVIEKVSYIAPVEVVPGEMEMEALALGALRVLNGEEIANLLIFRRRSMLKDFNNLLEEAKKLEPVIVSVAVAEDKEVLKAVKSATDLNIIKPILVGDKDKIENISKEIGLKGHEIIGCQNPDESVKKL